MTNVGHWPGLNRTGTAVNAERAHALPVISVKRPPLPSAAARQAELGF
jgi:hypothetical protein